MYAGLLRMMSSALAFVLLVVGCAGQVSASPDQVRARVGDVALDMPSWSPDGKWVVIDSVNPPGLVVVSRDGEVVRHLTKNAYHNEPEWSPAANVIAYVDKDAGGLWIIEDVLGQARARRVVAGALELYERCWSSDGSWIVFLTEKELGLANPKTGVIRRLLTNLSLAELTTPRWLTDGTRIIVQRPPYEIVGISVTDGATESVLGVRGVLFAVGPDGSIWGRADTESSQVTFRREPAGRVEKLDLGGDIRAIDVDRVSGDALVSVKGKGVAKVDRKTLDPRWITTGENEGPASWSPDGCVIAVVRKDGPQAGLFFVNAGGGVERCK